MDPDTKEVIDMLGDIVARMVTKDDIATMVTREDIANMVTTDDIAELRDGMQQGFTAVRSEIGDIRRQLERIELEVESHGGYAKEIDHLIERVGAIEKHLGLQRKLAA